MVACGLSASVIPENVVYINTPLGHGSVLSRICKSVDVSIADIHLPIDMLVLPISDFDVVLGMNWLNKYQVIIDCSNAELRFNRDGKQISCTLLSQRPASM